MLDIVEEFTFELNKPIKAHIRGESRDVSVLTIKAPCNRNQKFMIKLRQGLNRAIMGMAKPDEASVSAAKNQIESSDSDDEFDAGGYTQMMFMSSIDMVQYCEDFKGLLLQTCFMVDSIPLTSPCYDQMLESDTQRLLGEYLKTFLSLSKMKG
jgi:hypothetical protein